MKIKIFQPYEKDLFCAISDRHGGVSQKPYDSLNVALHTGDEAKNVIRNRIILADKFDFLVENLIYMQQVHSNNIEIIEHPAYNKIENCDALITDKPNIPLMVMVADCIPVMMYDPKRKVVAAIHAGRNGTFKRIVQKSVNKMKEHFNSSTDDIVVYLGPSIHSCCYEVGKDLADITIKSFSKEYIKKRDDLLFLDLQKLNYDQLRSVGIKGENIEISNICTCCDKNYFSYRRDKTTGRFAGFIKLKNG